MKYQNGDFQEKNLFYLLLEPKTLHSKSVLFTQILALSMASYND